MGCYAIKAAERGIETILATNDKDLYQLVNAKVKIYSTAKADLASPKDAFALLGEEEVTAKWDVPPAMIGDVLAISGDAVDNIPGVGIGRKAAAKLLREFGSLEALIAGLDSDENCRKRAINWRPRANASCKIARWSSSIAICLCRCRSTTCGSPPDYPRLIEAMEGYEFKSLLQEVRDEAAGPGARSRASFCSRDR